MSDRGLALNDCHAEIVARRSLVRYLYSQLENFLRLVDSLSPLPFRPYQFLFDRRFSLMGFVLFFSVPSNHEEEQHKSIFMRRDDQQGFQLKENVQFHLYISTSPCGDARIFSPHEAGVEGKQQTRGGERRVTWQWYAPFFPLVSWLEPHHAVFFFFFCSVRPGRQTPKQEGPRAAPDQDRVRRGHHPSALKQHHSDVGWGSPGGEAAYHVLQRQNCQVGCLQTWVTIADWS